MAYINGNEQFFGIIGHIGSGAPAAVALTICNGVKVDIVCGVAEDLEV